MINSPEELKQLLNDQNYLVDDFISTTVYLACALEKPLLVEGPAGVGKTQLAICLARALDKELIRLQCYEGIDASKALYDWDYPRQLLRIQAGNGEGWERASEEIFGREFLLQRPLLRSLLSSKPALLLIDELDKSGEEFESFLLELLADFQVTIPELGTVEAKVKPLVVLTSNGSRDFSDALRRRCLHLYINYPDMAREQDILTRICTESDDAVLRESVELIQRIRKLPLHKLPSISESIDFVNALAKLKITRITPESLTGLAGTILKYPQDIKSISEKAVVLTGFDKV
jgi:MoxR-like ATPase